MNQLPNQLVIENVVQYKQREKVCYSGSILATTALTVIYVKPFDDPSGKGYQRPVIQKKCSEFATYLSKGDSALFPPILLNSESNWEFVPYDKQRPNFGRLICNKKASLLDGQHRLGGIKIYIQETNSELNIPFVAFHFLDYEEEIELFDTINTKGKQIGSSLSKYLLRHSDDLSWIATELVLRNDSPFHSISTITGKRTPERHVTLQNLYRFLEILTKPPHVSRLSKEDRLMLALIYFNSLKNHYMNEWSNYKEFRITHIVCLNALSIVGAAILSACVSQDKKQIDFNRVDKFVKKINGIDWASSSSLRYIRGATGSKTLASEIISQIVEH
ncbi:DGQHR domain-containing protein [Paenibacillus alginolyticus]|uniref:DGQHR domain-containing protein n=1 Tax=Paenibacillus alginolyticus TaxID=59839 RepID=A0ABT4G819_9BACL|nr:DGQHR domain-containing protein [Paenibacillus alginolyticus]MCY9692268.1 DGQHR domain-containing protein [Paenibacillus alginolyticus]MEC0145890.1 DGQHR domain-containing protein [Paenibacillus alginolyticus]